MENSQAYNALLQVAERNGTSLENVIHEIESSIREAIDTAKRENNQLALNKWKEIPCAGEYPSAVELITYIGAQVKNP